MLGNYRGSFGVSLRGKTKKEIEQLIPTYCRDTTAPNPDWKLRYIRENRLLYDKYQKKLKPIITKLKTFPFSWQKFEWNCGDVERNIFKFIIQFRSSGVRVRLNDSIPSLVLSSTQIPVIAWEKRFLTKYEARKFQSLGALKLPKDDSKAFPALGNAVNAEIVRLIAKNLLK